MKRFFVTAVAVCMTLIWFALIAGCSGNSAEEVFKTAQFEEVQNNREHAEQLYSDILQKYPDTEYAVKAKERLSQMKKE